MTLILPKRMIDWLDTNRGAKSRQAYTLSLIQSAMDTDSHCEEKTNGSINNNDEAS